MKKIILLLLISFSAAAIFSQFVQVTSENIKNHKGEMLVKKVGNEFEFQLKGINDHHAWLITTDKPIKGNAIFRSYIWHKKFESGKIIKIDNFYNNKDKTKYGVIPKFKVPADEVNRTYLYMDSPVQIEDGGFYYTFVLGSFISQSEVPN